MNIVSVSDITDAIRKYEITIAVHFFGEGNAHKELMYMPYGKQYIIRLCGEYCIQKAYTTLNRIEAAKLYNTMTP